MNAITQMAADGSAENEPDLLASMKVAPIWLLWKSVQLENRPKPSKVPFYASGQHRSGALDSPEDRAQLVTHAAAAAAYERAAPGSYAGLGYALGPDGRGGSWQGIDLDNIEGTGLSDIANQWVRGNCAGWGYVELSPSSTGAHIVGYGREFKALGSNATGIEAYSGGRFFTYTGRVVLNDSACRPVDLCEYVDGVLGPRHAVARLQAANDAAPLLVDAKTVAELRSALAHLRADDRDLWIAIGHALKTLGGTGRGLWIEWSQTSDKYDPHRAGRTWDSFQPRNTGYQAVFGEARRQGWINPRDAERSRHGAGIIADWERNGELLPGPSTANDAPAFKLEFAMETDTATLKLDYLVDPWLPLRCVVGFYGRGSTAKSSFLASKAAGISHLGSTLWISVEEPDDWIKVRHIRCGGADKTLAVVKAIESKRDKQGRIIASSFNLLEDLEPAIQQARDGFVAEQRPPLRLVVLDTAVGLTTWGKGESPNDDAAVKKLLAHLQAWAEKYNLTIAVIGHSNKGTHDHLADSVMGAAAWTNSPRLSFIHAADRRDDYAYVVRVAKSNFQTFGAPYRTEPVHTLYERENGPDTVLVKVVPGELVWGSLDSMEMFKAATKVPRDDDDGGGSEMPAIPKVAEVVLQTLIAAVLEVPQGGFVTREQVEQRYGRPVDRARWQKVEQHLSGHPTISIERGEKNKALYRRAM